MKINVYFLNNEIFSFVEKYLFILKKNIIIMVSVIKLLNLFHVTFQIKKKMICFLQAW